MTAIIVATIVAIGLATGLSGTLYLLDQRAARRRRRALSAWYAREFDR